MRLIARISSGCSRSRRPRAYRFFAQRIDESELAGRPWHVRVAARARCSSPFTARLSPARRALYGIGLVMAFVGLLDGFHGLAIVRVPIPFGPRVPLPGLAWSGARSGSWAAFS